MADVSRTTLVLGTGAGVLGVDQLTPTINWILDGCHGVRPESTAGLIATLLIVGLTALWHVIQAVANAKPGAPVLGASETIPAAPAARQEEIHA